MGEEFLSLLLKAFFQPLLTYSLLGLFPFVSVTNVSKSKVFTERLFASCWSPIPLFFLEATLPPLRVALTYFDLSFYERALRLSTSFLISDLAKLGVKSRFSWKAFASTHPLMLSSTSFREVIFACPSSPSFNPPSFSVELALFSPCSRSVPPLSC